MNGQLIIHTIQNLLFEHNCVIIPEFGAFIGDYTPAEISENGSFVPTVKKIAFNASITSNDGLLIHALQNKCEVTYNRAQEMVESFVNEMSGTIHEKRNLELNGIGTIYLTKENTLLFVPYREANFLQDSFGLSAVKLKKVNSTKVQMAHKDDKSESTDKIFEEIIENSENDTKEIPTETEADTSWIQWLNIAATLLIGAMVVGMAFPSWFESNEPSKIIQANIGFDSVELPDESKVILDHYHSKVKPSKQFVIISKEKPLSSKIKSASYNNERVYVLETFYNEKFANEYMDLLKYQAPDAVVISEELLTTNH